MTVTKDPSDFAELSKAEAMRFKGYFENEYRALYPPPISQKGMSWKQDWRLISLMTTAFAIIVVAALRTAQMFYFAETLSAGVWGLEEGSAITLLFAAVAAFFSMVAFEGGLFVIAAVKTYEKDEVEDWVFNTQLVILVVISVMAGVGQSIGLIQNLNPEIQKWFTYLLVAVLGVGTSIGAWLSGEIIGVQIKKLETKNKQAIKDFDEESFLYQKQARRFWKQRTDEERAEQTELKREERENAISKVLTEKQSALFNELELYREEAIANGKNDVIGVKDLLERLQNKYPELGFAAKSYISTERSKWIKANPQYFEEV